MITGLAVALLLASPAQARIYSAPIDVEAEEDLESLYTDGVIDEAAVETLTELLYDPLDLNRARRNELYNLPGVTLTLAREIVVHRRQNEPYSSYGDLLAVEGMTRDILEQIRPFTEVRPPAAVLEQVRGKVRARTIKNFEPADPVTESTSSFTPQQLGYEKWPDTYLSARAEYQRKYKVGMLGLAREGLDWSQYDPDTRTLYASYGSPVLELGKAYVSVEETDWEAIAGSYTAGFGLGLTFDVTNRTHPHGIYEDLIVTGTDSLRVRKGLVGVTGRYDRLPLGEVFTLDSTVFASSWRYDIYQYDLAVSDGDSIDPIEEETSTPTVLLDYEGGWRKGRYLTIPDAYREDVVGANATLRYSDRGHIGATAYVGRLDTTSIDGVQAPDYLFPSSGFPTDDVFGAAGLNAAWSFGISELLAEYTRSFTGSYGALVKSITDVHIGEIEASLRSYDTDFDNPHARGLANADEYGGMRDRDEQGARLKGDLAPLPWLSTRFMGDLWKNISEGRTNAELYGRVDATPMADLRLTLFGDIKDRDVYSGGRSMEYGGDEWVDEYGDTHGDYYGDTLHDPSYDEEDDEEETGDYDKKGSKRYVGIQIRSEQIPATRLYAMYKRIYEDTRYLYPLESDGCCDHDFQVGHYWWVKAMVYAGESTTLTGRFRYQDEDIWGDKGDRYVEGYLQWSQRLPSRMKFLIRGTLGRDLQDNPSEWEDWCDRECQYEYDDICTLDGASSSGSGSDSEIETYGQLKATFEWRF